MALCIKPVVFLLCLTTGCDGRSNESTENTAASSSTSMEDTETTEQTGTSSSAFADDLESHNASKWSMANDWANGAPFWVGWRSDHVEFSNGILRLRLDDQFCPMGCSHQPYASGEYRTNAFFSYGCIKSRFKAAQGAGVVSSLFIYTGASDNNPHDEIDIEILGKATTQLQVNYFTHGVGSHEKVINLGFDAAYDFHTYAFDWSSTAIHWYVDGQRVHTEDGARGELPKTAGRIMVNLWAGTGVDAWLQPFVYSGSPLYADYDWITFNSGQCK